MAATEDRKCSYRDGNSVGWLVAAAAIYAGTFVCANSSNYLVNGSDAANLRFAGVCERAVDNSAGSAGDETAHVLVDGVVLVKGTGFDAGDIGKTVYLVDNETVGFADDVDHHIVVGTLFAVQDAATVWVKLYGVAQPLTAIHVAVAGVDGSGTPAVLDLASAAAALGGSDLYIQSVIGIIAITTSSGAFSKYLALTTDYTLSGGDVTIASNQSGKTLVILGYGQVVS